MLTLQHYFISSYKIFVESYENNLEKQQLKVTEAEAKRTKLEQEFEAYRDKCRETEHLKEQEIDDLILRTTTCESNLKDCRKQTDDIAQLADESIRQDQSLHEEFLLSLQDQVKKLEEKVAAKQQEVDTVSDYSAQSIKKLTETLKQQELVTRNLRQQLVERDVEVQNLRTSFTSVYERLLYVLNTS